LARTVITMRGNTGNDHTQTFTYGYGRVEDFAGLAIVLIILLSALVAGYEAIDRLFHPVS